jgi:hypothetical protein
MRVNTTAAVTLRNQNLDHVMKHLLFPFAAFEAKKVDVILIIPFDIEQLAVRVPYIKAILQVE